MKAVRTVKFTNKFFYLIGIFRRQAERSPTQNIKRTVVKPNSAYFSDTVIAAEEATSGLATVERSNLIDYLSHDNI